MPLALALLVTAVAAASPAPPPPPVVSGELGAKLDRYLTASGYEGVALVAKDGKILLQKGYGIADREKNEPWAADSLVSVGSITKQFTAAAILKLETEGKLRVEDTIARFFPDAPEDKKGITLHQLLTHTAGLESDFAGDYEPVGRDAYVKRILGSKLRSKPGTEHSYANSGYSLLAAIVEIASKQPYETYLREHLFVPAGMTETGYRGPRWEARRVPVGYRDGKRWGTMLEKPWAEDGPFWALRGNGGIESTLTDLFTWSRALDTDAVLPAAERKKLFTPYVKEGPNAESSYAYGWAVFTTPWGARLIAHDGGNGVFSADFRRYVDDGIVVITGAADSRIKAFRVSGPLARIVRGEDVPPDRAAGGTLAPLPDNPRAAVVRGFIEALNTRDLEKVHAFREAHVVSRPDAPSVEERDRTTKRMWEEFGTLNVLGVVPGGDAEGITVAVRGTTGAAARFSFLFGSEDRITGIRVEAGD